MSLDTKYRPVRFTDVLGQEATVKILRRYVSSGAGFHQSYLFSGPWGGGKTTLARILARALLCEVPVHGDPCDQCPSCKSFLERGSSDCFYEVDAATNSGKDDILRITEEAEYDTFSGKRRIYLLDESHALSPQALDGLLKPLEENVPGSADKKLICIFCTTEPEKMRATILSRCAPAFVIRSLEPAIIAARLAEVCRQEGIEYEEDALRLIAEVTECHVRDALKAVEGISMLGSVSVDNVATYLHMDTNVRYLDLLLAVGTDFVEAMRVAEELLQVVSPLTCYQKLLEATMTAYRVHLGVGKPDPWWDQERLRKVAARGQDLLGMAIRFSTRPGKPTKAMLLCDVAALHHFKGGFPEGAHLVMAPATTVAASSFTGTLEGVRPLTVDDPDPEVYVDPRARKREDGQAKASRPGEILPGGTLSVTDFGRFLRVRLAELAPKIAGRAG